MFDDIVARIKEEIMHYSFSDGRVLDIPDMCGYCEMTTGGQHQLNCPAFPAIYKQYQVGGDSLKIRIREYDDNGNFVKEI